MDKPAVLNDKRIEAIIQKTFPVFELNEEGEEERKQTILQLLAAQRDADVAYREDI